MRVLTLKAGGLGNHCQHHSYLKPGTAAFDCKLRTVDTEMRILRAFWPAGLVQIAKIIQQKS